MTVTRHATFTRTNVGGTSTNTLSLDRHPDLADGHLLLLWTNGPIGTHTPPSGAWTLLGSFTDGTTQSNMYKKIASSEPATWTVTFSVSDACCASIVSFVGYHDVLLWDAKKTGATSSLSARRTDAARDSIGYSVACWVDTASDSMTESQGSEEFDGTAGNTGLTTYRGIAGVMYGPGVSGVTDVVNIGDGLPGTVFTSSGAVTGGIVWQVLIDNAAPDAETWSSANGSFAVELKLDSVELDALGGISTVFRGDVTGRVSSITASGEVAPDLATMAADGRADTEWTVSGDSGWLQYDFGANNAQTIKRYRLTSSDDIPGRDPRDWILKGSNNGTDFTNLDTRSMIAFAARGEVQEFRVTSPGSYRYYRLDISTNRSPTTSTATVLAELRLSTIDVWEDITSYVTEESKIRVTRGL